MLILKNDKYKFTTEISVLSLLILFFLFRASNPLFKYPFIALYIGYFPLIGLLIKENGLAKSWDFIREFVLILLSFTLYILAFAFSDKLYLIVFKEVTSTLIIITFFYFLFYLVTSREKLFKFIDTFVLLIILISLLITASGIFNVFGVLRYQDYFLIEKSYFRSYPFDPNFGLLPVIFSVIAVLYFLTCRKIETWKVVTGQIILFLNSFFILLSGSRRGVLILLLIIIIALGAVFIDFIGTKYFNVKARNRILVFVSIVLITIISIFTFLRNASFSSKDNFLRAIGTKDVTQTKEQISTNLLKLYKFYDRDILIRNFHLMIWSMEFNSYEPDMGWGGMGVHETVYPLTGENVEIVPEGAKGYKMDKTYEAATWLGNAYSITHLGKFEGDPGSKYRASVFCYVSEDFSCDWARLVLVYSDFKMQEADYNLEKKGTWQKLELESNITGELTESRFYFADLGATNLDSMEGYVIIAFPRFDKYNKNGEVTSFYKYPPSDTLTEVSSFKQNNLPGTESAIFPVTFSKYIMLFEDPLRNWISRVFTEDSTYINFKTELVADSVKLPLPDNRSSRWKLGLKIYFQEYGFLEKMIGGGFKHMSWYGYLFLRKKDASDWPHNPFISILLYSGVIGLVVSVILFYKAVKYYIMYLRDFPLPFIFFALTFIFSFVSGDSPFDPPVMGFFVMLPFLIHYIHKKDPAPS